MDEKRKEQFYQNIVYDVWKDTLQDNTFDIDDNFFDLGGSSLQNGRRVPEDVQLVGFDNIEFSRRMTPELTTISQPIEEMGKLAVQMIIHHGEEISYQKENIFDVELIRRQTTKKKGEAE